MYPLVVELSATPINSKLNGFWSVDSLSSPNIPSFTAKTNNNTTVTNLVEGVYKFIWRVQDSPCFDISDTVIVSVFEKHIAVVGPDQLLCNKPRANITGNSVSGLAKGNWGFAYTSSVVSFSDSTKNSTSVNNMVAGGVYSSVWKITNGVCPVSSDTLLISNKYQPVAYFGEDKNEICLGEKVNFYSSSSIPYHGKIVTEDWFVDNKFFQNNSFDYTFEDTGFYDVKLIVTALSGCADTVFAKDEIYVHSLPIAGFDLLKDPNLKAITLNDKSVNSSSLLYFFGNGDTSSQRDLVYLYSHNGEYVVKQVVKTDFGCVDSVLKTIKVYNATMFIPNSFTPNNDGRNDVFTPVVRGIDDSSYEFTIFNKWGELIFNSQTPNEGWDGTFKSEKLSSGAFVWVLKYKQENSTKVELFRGHVNLIR